MTACPVRSPTSLRPVHRLRPQKASAITPVPGGVGPMTIAMLLKNTLNLARNSVDLPRLPLRRTSSKS